MAETPTTRAIAAEDRSPWVLISGIPATGKSTYGRWLEDARGFLHIDVENGGLDRLPLRVAWTDVLRQPSGNLRLQEALAAVGRGVVLDWGYPPGWLPAVRALHESGVTAWWFDGDREAARRSFLKRGNVSVEALDVQMARIKAVWTDLADFYAGRMIRAVDRNDKYTSAEEIFTMMFGG